MMVAPGTLEYSLGAAPVTGCGISWTADELNAALAGPVAEVIFDDAGKADLASLLAGLSETEFDRRRFETCWLFRERPKIGA
jgi:hypothetical protein